MQELSKGYNPTDVEQKWYKFWEENDLFSPDETSTAEPFTIVMPPPNVTGSLHMGHALDNSIQDVLIRYKRMQGFKTLWVPGTDHAGIATQNVVERELKKEGKRKEDLGREKFLEKVWEWKKEYGGRITTQLRRLGASCDWNRERFTMDEGLSKAVTREFVTLYNEGLIYRGKRIINWCSRCLTALSDIEVEYQEKKGSLWHLRYPIEKVESRDSKLEIGDYIVVATTRPETMLGDTAIAVNPKDDRYKHLIGKMIVIPLVNRKIPIIKDDFVDPSFGTGAVKVTPAHDPNDYEMGDRHNLPKINILTPDAKITFAEFPEEEKRIVAQLEGLDRFKAREALVKLLEEKGFLEKVEDYSNSVGHCYRCKTVIEPYLSDQWFVKIKPLAEEAIKIVEKGKTKFLPDRWTKVYLNWMVNLKDWCISRQLWWGHRIPAWECGGMSNVQCPMSNGCREIIVSETTPESCPKCGGTNLVQDPDVFDTWFSSGLWPFSTLGWPDETKDLKAYYPTSVLVTAYDIIFFWVARMIMAGTHFMKKPPFHTIFIHGLIRDITGKKMSKSVGNVIDPISVIDTVGADALRFALISLATGGGQDIKLAEEKITEARNFANKIWNVSRFVMMTLPDATDIGARLIAPLYPVDGLELADKWILSRYNSVVKKIAENLDNFQIGESAKLLYDFIWSEFCDWYIEIAKIRLYGDDPKKKEEVQSILLYILEGILKLLHPFMPFETEEIYQILKGRETPAPKESIMLQSFPVCDEKLFDEEIEYKMRRFIELVRAIRSLRDTLNIAHKEEIKLISPSSFDEDEKKYLKALAKISTIEISDKYPPHTVVSKIKKFEFGLPIEGLVDFKEVHGRLEKDYNGLGVQVKKIEEKLQNENFVKNATEGSIQKEKTKLEEYNGRLKVLEGYLRALS
ncbi:valine--tRNA ligase [candidate division WOR-1 bacterium RIFOXYC2_FULL_37_10]|uniref:Valine--tRNA ligase n=1 Tax=candidate division WOR-1 bacterium RIFOXYB2_FULL_37_13 TaxID=1802579 RepID=A0A1F4SH76_UNCSA|nr:MAG: valine--tRNA ligase [candidate division WOR-1 bacterium RIFOXYB2_FULL_37_13]OGC37336.1 MAG: valine--tRNA ligase [candidate division WOR-1 bacterium RIFOXYC2_FULL_37_10]